MPFQRFNVGSAKTFSNKKRRIFTSLLGPFLYAWGQNVYGQLGIGNTTGYSSPKQVSTNNWLSLSSGYNHSIATKTDGTLWAWGNNASGQLGLGNRTLYSSPKQVGSLTSWLKVACGGYFSLAIKSDGTMWAWGSNGDGQLGHGNITNYSSPKQVGALTNWSKIGAGYNHSIAIKTDGTFWSWGYNYVGQLGLGNSGYTNTSSPSQVGSLTTWSTVAGGVASSFAIKTDGTMWAWGNNGNGRLGLNSATYAFSSPNQIGALTTWLQVAGGRYFAGAIKTDGTLWNWGRGTNGVLGLGNTTTYSSPKQIGGDTNWAAYTPTAYSGLARKTNGTLWSWGDNNAGQLGLGDVTNRSSPVQIGLLTNWTTSAGGYYFAIAIGE
jgi:alpha-tubulin suppressor-like RCC1 family protein